MKKMLNKRGQVADGLNWFVATIVIVIVLTTLLYITVLNDSFNFVNKDLVNKNSIDLIMTKTLSNYLLSVDGQDKQVFSQLRSEENFNDFNGLLAKKVFFLSEDNYPCVLVSIYIESVGFRTNKYFGEKASSKDGTHCSYSGSILSQDIQLNDKKRLELILIGGK